ncbi:Zinc finger, RING/FYVE/PHD-type [Phytophthora cactorum]|nr:Zinc finger, RING/FYVE/PHD-type [Phytophthora cactorum]
MTEVPSSSLGTLLKQRVWAGLIPVVFSLDPNEVTLSTRRAMVPRMSYLVSQTRDVVEYFRDAAPPMSAMQGASIWFEAKSVPLHWHLPFGLLRDLLLKQATFLRMGSTKAVMALPEAQQTQIWTSISQNDYESYRQATRELQLDGGVDASALRHLPLRVHLDNAPAIQMPIPRYKMEFQLLVHGIPVPADVSIVELYRNFAYADGFLYVALSPNFAKEPTQISRPFSEKNSFAKMHGGTPHDDTATRLASNVEPLLAETRAHLLHKEPDRARASFLRLPELESRRKAYLEATLRDFYAAGLFDVPVLLTFLEALPSWHWTLDGCAVLHNVSSALRAPSSDAGGGGNALRALEVRQRKFPQMPLAFFLLKLMSHLEGSARVRAESYWYAWVSPTLRAVASGQPLELKILSRTGRSEYRQGDASKEELLYAPGNAGTFDNDRRNALCWVEEGSESEVSAWPDDKDRTKAQWRLIPSDVHTDTFLVQSVRFEEYLYSADYAKFKKDARGKTRSRVFTWRKQGESAGPAGKWQLVSLSVEERDVFALYNPYQREFLYSPTADLMDSKRRHVLTRAAPDGARESSNTEGGPMWCAWRIAPAQQSSMERAPDFQAIQALGGDKAAIFHGLAHLWEENASYLAAMATSSPDLQIQAIEISTSPDNPFFMRHQLSKGDDYFVRRDFQAAIVCYQEAATCTPTTTSSSSENSMEDPETTRQRVRAYVSCAKCFFALDESENAWQYLSIAHDITGVSVEGEAAIFLWKGKCRRAQKSYDESLELLEKAFDRASAASAASVGLSSAAAGAPMSAAVLKRSILMEMKVVGLLRQGVYDTLLSTDEIGAVANGNDTKEDSGLVTSGDAEKTLTQMMEIFHCPLSLELMDDPVTTPDGNTYERSMIEQHLEVNGCFDPLTRAPLTKSQLHPNRALKQLMETLLSDHRLGLLLASCST